MRKLLAVAALALSTTACWGPVEQTSPAPLSAVPAAARSKEVQALCKSLEKTDGLCVGMDKLGEKKPAAH